jgi:predicted 3-demethylubiquinone-9 3-methyltransferase (glyoxalase superfamily)
VKDKFGLSWQIVPYNMGELSKTDAQVKAMMKMKKIIIKELEEADAV